MKRHRPWWVRSFQYLYSYKLTPAGRVAALLILLSAAGIVTVEIPVYQIFCGVISLFGVAEAVGTLCGPRLQVTGRLPEKIAAGETAQGLLTVKNVGRWPARDVMCRLTGLPQEISHADAHLSIGHLPAGRELQIPVSLLAFQRGDYPLPDIQVHSTFPLNLMRFGGAEFPTRKLTVIPAYQRLQTFEIPIVQRYQAGGTLLQSRTGEASEYAGNREYVPGEPVRRLDFRAWARLGRPVVREFQGEFSSRVALVLDTHAPRRWLRRDPQAREEFEAAVSLTASITDALEGMQTSLDLFAAGPDLFLFHSPEGGTHLDAVMEILAAVESSRQNPFEDLAPALNENLESTSVVLCILLDWDDSRQRMIRRVHERGCSSRVFLVRERPPTLQFPDQEGFLRLTPQAIQSGDLSIL